MKKFLVLFLMMAISQMMAAQKSLIGTWKGTDGYRTVLYVFSKSNKLQIITTYNIFRQSDISRDWECSAQFTETMSGTYEIMKGRFVDRIRIKMEKYSNDLGEITIPDSYSEEERRQKRRWAQRLAESNEPLLQPHLFREVKAYEFEFESDDKLIIVGENVYGSGDLILNRVTTE